jgi:hypothetical protein
MFTLLRNFQAARRVARLARLIELATQTDEVLMGCKLEPDTRLLLQQKRDQLEGQIRQLQTA